MLAKQKAFINELREDVKASEAKKEARQERMEAVLGLRPRGYVTGACPENSKACLGEMKAALVTFEESSDKIEATDLKANPGEMEAQWSGRRYLMKR
jgi:hypothetical protein